MKAMAPGRTGRDRPALGGELGILKTSTALKCTSRLARNLHLCPWTVMRREFYKEMSVAY